VERTREVVCVPVSDIDRAKTFYAEQVGFKIDYDSTFTEEYRVVQLTPPGSGCSIVIGTRVWAWQPSSPPLLAQMEPGSLRGVQLVLPDIEAARTELVANGVEVSDIQHFENGTWVDRRGGDWNSFAFFSDPDGNGWVMQESPAHS
jgi:catechol 2,3-dioxygenase-like lactoylglutathione lyase family enzyme